MNRSLLRTGLGQGNAWIEIFGIWISTISKKIDTIQEPIEGMGHIYLSSVGYLKSNSIVSCMEIYWLFTDRSRR